MRRWPYDIIVPVFLPTLPTFSSLLFNHYDVSAMIYHFGVHHCLTDFLQCHILLTNLSKFELKTK
jgi:hypothetical protein